MSLTEQAEQTKKEIDQNPRINNVWELILAVMYKFGLGAGAVVALMGLLMYGTSVVWDDRGHAYSALDRKNQELTKYLMESAQKNADLAVQMTVALGEATAVARETAQANQQLARAIDDLSYQIKQTPKRTSQP